MKYNLLRMGIALYEYYWHGTKLKNEIENLSGINTLKITTAYFSEYGFELLKDIINKNKLSKNQVLIYLSPEFSKTKPGKVENGVE